MATSSRSSKGPLLEPALCRCCRSIKKCRLLTAEYDFMDKKEVYSDLFVECFGLVLPHLDGDPKDAGICATCVGRLREAHAFKAQVLQSQEAFLYAKLDGQISERAEDRKFMVDVKMEQGKESDTGSDRMDAYDSEDDKPLKTQWKKTVAAKTRACKDKAPKNLLKKVKIMQKKLEKKIEKLPVTKPSKSKSKTDKLADSEHMACSNAVAIVRSSYVCPFHTRVSFYYCFYCKMQFTDPAELRTHTLTHDPKDFENMMENNKIPKIDITRIDCRLCDTKIDDLPTLKKHITSVHKKTIHPIENEFLKFKLTLTNLKCTECGDQFPYFDALKKHMNEHFGTFVCDMCGACFLEITSLASHIRGHNRIEINYPCEICGKNLKSKYSRHLHIATVHEKKATVNCYKCEETFMSHALRNRHLIEAHGDKRTFPCKLCDKVYNRRKTLMEHSRRIHQKVRAHQCALCGQRFYIPSRLREHLAAHSGERLHRCDLCDKTFPRLHSLQEHMRSHTEKHNCNLCDSTFTLHSALKAHFKSEHPGYEGFG